jgi:O-antigen/teichoic acid export membrane protein
VAVLVATAGVLAGLCWHALPEWRGGFRLRRDAVGPIVKLGGWMSVTSLVGTPMLYGDRYLIGALLGAEAVTYYAVPFDLVTKLWLLPLALAGVMLPALAATSHDRAGAGRLFRKAVKHTFILVFPAVLAVCTFAPEGLALWLHDAKFAARSTPVLQMLCAGVLVSSISVLPLTALQSAGRPDLSAKLYLVEAPFYIGVTLWAIATYGLVGAAAAWAGRLTLETVVLLLLARRALGLPARAVWQPAAALAGGLGLLALGAALPGLGLRAAGFAAVVIVFLLAVWRLALDDGDRALLRRFGRESAALPQEVKS